SAPIASASRSALSACGGPIVTTTVSAPSLFLSLIASVSARLSNGLISDSTPSRITRRVSWSNLSWSIYGTCLMQTTIFMTLDSMELEMELGALSLRDRPFIHQRAHRHIFQCDAA